MAIDFITEELKARRKSLMNTITELKAELMAIERKEKVIKLRKALENLGISGDAIDSIMKGLE